jgi:diguanylate cyclase (GGDEF)-like protein
VKSVGLKLVAFVAIPTLLVAAIGALWAYTNTDATFFYNAVIVILLGVLLFSILLFLATKVFVTQRLARLADTMQRAGDGNILVRATNLGNDEIGTLANSFNQMLMRLTDLQATEIETRRELEIKQSLESRMHELQLLFDLVRTSASTLNLNEVLSSIASVVPTQLGVPHFSIMLMGANDQLEVVHSFPSTASGMQFKIGEGICGTAAATKRSVYVPDLETSKEFVVRGVSSGQGRGSLFSVPMVIGQQVVGVINLERPEKAAFGAQDIDFFTAVANHAAIAVHNARLHEQTVALSVTDPLTGVPNRRFLYQQLESELSRAQRYETPMSLLMIDIDHFKHLNDVAGHSAGDEGLRKVTNVLKSNLRKVDTLARYGGEEFVVLLPQVGAEQAFEVAEKLRAAVEANVNVLGPEDDPLRVTISLGVATAPKDGVDQTPFIDAADAALYASKRNGRNRVTTYVEGMKDEPTRRRGPLSQRSHSGIFRETKAAITTADLTAEKPTSV